MTETMESIETREYDDSSALYILAIDGKHYTRHVELNIETDNDYGADIDGRRGMRVRFIAIDRVLDKAPALDSPHREEWDELVPSAESLMNDWVEQDRGNW